MTHKLTATPATVQSAARACETFVRVLMGDPRVQRTYVDWWLSLQGKDAEHRRRLVEHLIHSELRLEYRWLPRLISMDFAATALLGEGQGVSVTPGEVPDLPPGRRAKHAADHIARDVQWYCRAEIKHPRDTKHALGREYAVTAGRRTEAKSVIQAGIARAKLLLSIFESEAEPGA